MTTSAHTAPEEAGVSMSGSPPRENLVRLLGGREIGLRDKPGSGMPLLFGHFAVTDVWTEINSRWEGHFLERMAPGAFKKTLGEGLSRIRCLFQHGKDPNIGMKVLGTPVVLREDEIGAYYEVELVDAHYVRELVPGLQAGLYGASFQFEVMVEQWDERPRRSDYNPEGLPERTVLEARVPEFGPVTFGAYADATSGCRSVTDEFILKQIVGDTNVQISVPSAITSERALVEAVRDGLRTERDSEARAARLYERASEYVMDTPWAVHPPMLKIIQGILEERRSGKRLTAEEITERIGERDNTAAVSTDPGVAVIDIGGTIMPHGGAFSDVSSNGVSVDTLMGQLNAALASSDVKAIMLNIDSPGGSVELVPELANAIYRGRDTKPIVAQVNAFAASAAYWIASAASEIVVTPSGQVGSIGVYSAHTDHSAQDEMLGEKTTLISAGKYKVEANPYEPLGEEAAAEIQSKVDAYYDMFVSAVAKGRGVKASDVRDGFGQGRMVMSSQAVSEGMADKIGTFDETLARLIKTKPPTEGAKAALEPTPSVAVTPTTQGTEPEPSEATTHVEAQTTGHKFKTREEWLQWLSKS